MDAELVGSIGVGLLLLAYVLQLMRVLPAGSATYEAMNAVGAGVACLASWMLGFVPFIVLEAIWTLVSVVALARRLRRSAGPA